MNVRPSSLARLLFLAALLLTAACQRFDNPNEKEAVNGSAIVKVSVNGLDPRASVLVVDLHWNENASSGTYTFRKLVALSGDTTHSFVRFEGLGAGFGYAEAATFIGSILWQSPQRGQNLQIREGGLGVDAVLLGMPDGDLDTDFDLDLDWPDSPPESDTEVEAEFDEETETEAESEAEWSPAASIDVPYSPSAPTMDGTVLVESEWGDAARVTIQTGLEQPTSLYVKHNALNVFFAMWIPSLPTPSGQTELDRVLFGFEVNPETAVGDAYVISVLRKGDVFCSLLNASGRTCPDLNPRPRPTALVKEIATGEGWMIEMSMSFSSLGIDDGHAKSLRFAALSFDNSAAAYFSWPPSVPQVESVWGWGELTSSGEWSFVYPDGDNDSDLDVDPDPDLDPDTDPDPDSDTGGDPDNDLDADSEVDPDTDLDLDLDPDHDADTLDADSELTEGMPGYCAAQEFVCLTRGSETFAKRCNAQGTDFAPEQKCLDDNFCTDDACLAGAVGCYYPFNNLPCVDSLFCTINEHCEAGVCVFEQMDCDDHNACTIDTRNTANPACCEHTQAIDGSPCSDGLTCTSDACESGSCVSHWLNGCCEGHPDMRLVVQGDAFCVDPYEATVADYGFSQVGHCEAGFPGTQYGNSGGDNYPAGFPDGVSVGTQTTPLYACSRIDLKPSAYLTLAQASTACANVGKRLCTSGELEAACAGEYAQPYPYGNAYESGTCNGVDSGTGTVSVNGSFIYCERDDVYNLSGNLEEWTSDSKACGGGFGDNAAALVCTSCPARTAGAIMPTRGFRCCATPNAAP